MPFGSGLSAPLAGSRSRTLTMDVHSRSASHPLLGRLRIGASRLWPLSPELHTSDCSFACPGSSTWVDKVPSRDTPTLDLSDCQGDPDSPQVARNQSKIGAAPGAITPASARTLSPPSVSIVTARVSGKPCRTASSRRADCSSWLATRPKYRSLHPLAMDLPAITSKLRFLSCQFRT